MERLGFSAFVISVFFLSYALLCGFTSSAFAEQPAVGGDFYIGLSASLERFDASYAKTTDTTDISPPAGLPQLGGNIYNDRDSSAETGFAYGVLGGYRVSFGKGLFWIAAEIDAVFGSSEADGRLQGIGESPGRNQYGESWPDVWSIDKDREYGFTLLVGFTPNFLSSLMGGGTSIYALAGVRRMKLGLGFDYTGCQLRDRLCSAAEEFTSDMSKREETLTGVAAGAGIEQSFGSFSVRGELRYVGYGEQDWVTLPDPEQLGLRVPAGIDASTLKASLVLIKQF